MDYTARLFAAETDCLGDPDSTFDSATRNLEMVATSDEWGFQRCIRIKNTVDALELRAQREPSWRVLALLLHCEYQLWREYAPTGDVRGNPFLSHWVEAFQRLDTESAQRALSAARSHEATVEPTTEVIAAVRVEWIKKLLSGLESGMSAISTRTMHDMARLSVRKPFAIQPYIQILVEDGIYDMSHLPSASSATSGATSKSHTSTPSCTNGHPINEPSATNHYAHGDWKDSLLERLAKHPDTAVHELTRLPLELPHLDFLTRLLTEHTLESYSIEPEPVILSYIQHSLRTIERMGSPPPANTHQDSASPTNGEDATAPQVWEYGKEAQSRSVRLLLLFIKSLIRKGLVGVQGLYFEIQEICYRYVWIREVREFRKWIGEGEEEEGGGDVG
ncbi:hypothetical protein J1614_008815 [Plenodomus biglobosus]|nr:hypothetical protein J1614_008815 [Plenodomus biglobosus]